VDAPGAEHSQRQLELAVEKAVINPFFAAGPAVEIPIVDKGWPHPVLLRQQVHQSVDVLAGHVDDWHEDRAAGQVRDEPVAPDVVGIVARVIEAMVEQAHL
jgi:hypothetical protein